MRGMITVALCLALAACGSTEPGTTSPTPASMTTEKRADIYAALLGDRDESWGDQWINSEICADAGEPSEHTDCEPMSAELQAAMLERIPGARIAQDPERLMDRIFEDGGQTLHSFGPVDGTGERFQVGYSYYCGGLCASGGTSVVELVNGEWTVTGSVGPSWIS